MKTTKQMIEVMQHFASGGQVCYEYDKKLPAPDIEENPEWDWSSYNYGIVPTPPKEVLMYVKPGQRNCTFYPSREAMDGLPGRSYRYVLTADEEKQ